MKKIIICLLLISLKAWGQHHNFKGLSSINRIDSLKIITKPDFSLRPFLNLNITPQVETLNDTLYLYIAYSPVKKIKISQLQKVLNQTNDSLIRSGYLFNRLVADSLKIDSMHLSLYYQIKSLKKRRIDSIVMISKHAFPRNCIKRLQKKFKHQPINQSVLAQINQFVNQNTNFKMSASPLINFLKARNIVVIKAQLKKSHTLDGLLGFSYDKQVGKIQLEGHLKTLFYNLFNQNESISFKWQKRLKNQQMDFWIDMPYFMGTGFDFKNRLLTYQKDTINSDLLLESTLTLRSSRQNIGLIFSKEFKQTPASYQQTLTGLHYLYNFQFNNGKPEKYIESVVNFDWERKAISDFYFHLSLNQTLYKKLELNSQSQIYHNLNADNGSLQQLKYHLWRKENIRPEKITTLLSLKNEFAYAYNTTRIYLITDYIRTTVAKNLMNSYINTGLGVQILNKNQILTFEFILPLNTSYHTDNQASYINIKETIKF